MIRTMVLTSSSVNARNPVKPFGASSFGSSPNCNRCCSSVTTARDGVYHTAVPVECACRGGGLAVRHVDEHRPASALARCAQTKNPGAHRKAAGGRRERGLPGGWCVVGHRQFKLCGGAQVHAAFQPGAGNGVGCRQDKRRGEFFHSLLSLYASYAS